MFKKKKGTTEEVKEKSLLAQEFDQKQAEEEWERKKRILLSKVKIKQEKEDILNTGQEKQQEKKKMQTSKLLIFLLFINFFILEIFIMFVTIQSFALAFATGMTPDFTPLTSLIACTMGEAFSYWIYSIKSTKENTNNGINYLLAQQEFMKNENT